MGNTIKCHYNTFRVKVNNMRGTEPFAMRGFKVIKNLNKDNEVQNYSLLFVKYCIMDRLIIFCPVVHSEYLLKKIVM
jgi:hypothetical protein